jgi:hypothetical protein
VQILGIGLIGGGITLLAWFLASQAPGRPPSSPLHRGRNRVRFSSSFDLTAPVATVTSSSPLLLRKDERSFGRRLLGLGWLIVLIALVAAAVAAALLGLGRLIVDAITAYFESA